MQKYRILACLEESLQKSDFEKGSKVYRCLVTFRPKDFAGGLLRAAGAVVADLMLIRPQVLSPIQTCFSRRPRRLFYLLGCSHDLWMLLISSKLLEYPLLIASNSIVMPCA